MWDVEAQRNDMKPSMARRTSITPNSDTFTRGLSGKMAALEAGRRRNLKTLKGDAEAPDLIAALPIAQRNRRFSNSMLFDKSLEEYVAEAKIDVEEKVVEEHRQVLATGSLDWLFGSLKTDKPGTATTTSSPTSSPPSSFTKKPRPPSRAESFKKLPGSPATPPKMRKPIKPIMAPPAAAERDLGANTPKGRTSARSSSPTGAARRPASSRGGTPANSARKK